MAMQSNKDAQELVSSLERASTFLGQARTHSPQPLQVSLAIITLAKILFSYINKIYCRIL